jgi:soluble lytic murein transglycosylase-like protein
MSYYLISMLISANAYLYGIDKKIAHGVVFTESRHNPNSVGVRGELGLYQIRYEYFKGPLSLLDPEINIHQGLKNLKRLKKRLYGDFGTRYVLAHNLGTSGFYRYNKKFGLDNPAYFNKVSTRVYRR